MSKFRVFLACALIAAITPMAASAEPSQADVQARDELIFAQESLLNVYRCRFDIDVQIVPGGCVDGVPAKTLLAPEPFAGTATDREIAIRDHLIITQEALLNAYRCQFNIDTQIVPGGCGEDQSESPLPQVIGPWELHTGVLETTGESFVAYASRGSAQKLTITDSGTAVDDVAVRPVFVARCDAGRGLLAYVQMAGLIEADPEFAKVLVRWKFQDMEDAVDDLWTGTWTTTGTTATTLWATPAFIEHLRTVAGGTIIVIARHYNGYAGDSTWHSGRFSAEGGAEVINLLTPCPTRQS